MISGGIAGEHEAIDTPQLMADELEAVISTAHAWGRKVTAHAGPAGVIEAAVRSASTASSTAISSPATSPG